MTIDIEMLWLKPGCYAKCVGWGGETSRERLSDKQAIMLADTDTRLIHIEPIGRGDGMTIPLENALQWKPKQQPKRSTTRTSPATSAKA